MPGTTIQTETPPVSPIEGVLDRLQRVEQRLNRLLASGRRHAGDDLDEVAEEAAALAQLGLPEVAARLHAVASAADPLDGLRAAAPALAACRLVRARLAPDEPPAGTWNPIGPGKRTATSRLLPLARFALADGEVWSCLRLQSGYATEWILVEPPDPAREKDDGAVVPWCARLLTGRLRWRRRLPLGATGEVEICALEDAAWAKSGEPHENPLTPFFRMLQAGKKGDELAWALGGALKAAPFDPADMTAFAWPDAAAPTAVAAHAGRFLVPVLALTWTREAPVAVALFWTSPPKAGFAGLAARARGARWALRVIHLVPGLPSEEIPIPATTS